MTNCCFCILHKRRKSTSCPLPKSNDSGQSIFNSQSLPISRVENCGVQANVIGCLDRWTKRAAMDGNTASSDFVLQWGNGKRLRCMKFQSNSKESSGSDVQPMTRKDRRVIRSDLKNRNSKDPNILHAAAGKSHGTNGYITLRQRPASPSHRNSEGSISMRGHSNGVKKAFVSPDRVEKKGGTANKNNNINSNHQNDNHHQGSGSGGSGSSETAQEGKNGDDLAGSQGGNALWPPKFLIALTNKEKEEDFMAIKGSKLPQRPKKRAKFIQRSVNLVCPGSWLCDLTLERYKVREKKVSKKRPRGLKAMGGHMDSDSE